MPVRMADAQWTGTLNEGNGTMRLGGGAYEGPYSFASRFEEGEGTNPEELIAAAHAGCFSMKFAGDLGKAGYSPEHVATTAKVHLTKGDAGFAITRIDLETGARVGGGIDEETFRSIAEESKNNCPVSGALGAVPEITVTARLL